MVTASDGPLSAGLGGGGTACYAERVNAIPQKKLAASHLLIFMIFLFHGDGGSRNYSQPPP
jgi:hypothetical protein